MPTKKYLVTLTPEERDSLNGLLAGGKRSALTLTRARNQLERLARLEGLQFITVVLGLAVLLILMARAPEPIQALLGDGPFLALIGGQGVFDGHLFL